MKHNGWKFHYNTVYKNWRVWVKLILIKIRVFRKNDVFCFNLYLEQFLYKASSLHLYIAVIVLFICSTISCFWQRLSTQLSCKFWAPNQVQLNLWRITLQVEKLWFNGEVNVNKQFQTEMWGDKKVRPKLKMEQDSDVEKRNILRRANQILMF
jgi:hypothetical protein